MPESKPYPKAYLYRRVVQAKMYMDEHFANPINLNEISSEAAFSKYHFIRLFKKVYGVTPHQYLRSVRLDMAKTLMDINQRMTIEEICHQVGFESIGSFSSLFKKTFGLSPANFHQTRVRVKEDIKQRPLTYVPGCFANASHWV